jgi:hypothetical protein
VGGKTPPQYMTQDHPVTTEDILAFYTYSGTGKNFKIGKGVNLVLGEISNLVQKYNKVYINLYFGKEIPPPEYAYWYWMRFLSLALTPLRPDLGVPLVPYAFKGYAQVLKQFVQFPTVSTKQGNRIFDWLLWDSLLKFVSKQLKKGFFDLGLSK